MKDLGHQKLNIFATPFNKNDSGASTEKQILFIHFAMISTDLNFDQHLSWIPHRGKKHKTSPTLPSGIIDIVFFDFMKLLFNSGRSVGFKFTDRL